MKLLLSMLVLAFVQSGSLTKRKNSPYSEIRGHFRINLGASCGEVSTVDLSGFCYQSEFEKYWNFSSSEVREVEVDTSCNENVENSTNTRRGMQILFSYSDLPHQEKYSDIWKMLSELLTPETVIKGVKSFIDDASNRSVSNEDLFESIQAAADEDNRNTGGIPDFVKKMLQTRCKNKDSPVISVKRLNSTHIKIWQVSPNGNNSWWYIPVKIVYDGHQTWIWMEGDGASKTVEVPASSAWSIVDRGDNNFYRTIYKGDLITQLKSQFRKNCSAFTTSQRRQLVNDTLLLRGPRAFLSLTRYIDQERDLEIWQLFFDYISLTKLISHPDFSAMEVYLNQKLDSALGDLINDSQPLNSTFQLTSILSEPESSLRRYLFKQAIRLYSPLAMKMGRDAFNESGIPGKLFKQPFYDDDDVFIAMLKSLGEAEIQGFLPGLKPPSNTRIPSLGGITASISPPKWFAPVISGIKLVSFPTTSLFRGLPWVSEETKWKTLTKLINNVKDPKIVKRLLQETLRSPAVHVYDFTDVRSQKFNELMTFYLNNFYNIPNLYCYYFITLLEYSTKDQLNKAVKIANLLPQSRKPYTEVKQILSKKKANIEWVEKIGKEMLDWVKSRGAQELY